MLLLLLSRIKALAIIKLQVIAAPRRSATPRPALLGSPLVARHRCAHGLCRRCRRQLAAARHLAAHPGGLQGKGEGSVGTEGSYQCGAAPAARHSGAQLAMAEGKPEQQRCMWPSLPTCSVSCCGWSGSRREYTAPCTRPA